MTDTNPLAPIEVLADNWLAAGDAEGATAADDRVITALVSAGHQLRAALAEAREAVDGLVAERDYAERKAERYGDRWTDATIRHQAAEAERDRLREALGRAEALADDWTRSYPSLVIGPQLRAALTQPATDEEAGQ